MAKSEISGITGLVLKAVAVGMSIASLVMGFIPDVADVNTHITLLSQTYQQYMIDHIFEPLGMDQTFWTYDDALIAQEAAGSNPSMDIQTLMLPFLLDKDQMESLIREKGDGVTWFNRVYMDQKGPTGPISTVTDMVRFAMAILNEGELDGERILSEESVATMIGESHVFPGDTPEARAYTDYKQMYHGLGWYVVKNPDSLPVNCC